MHAGIGYVRYRILSSFELAFFRLINNMLCSKNVVRTWWPNGYGDQPLYPLNVSVNSFGNEEHYKQINIGFRTVELIEENASNKLSTF